MVQQDDASSARWRSGCDSRSLHLNIRSRGPTATTLGPHPGNDGSTPSGTTRAQIRQRGRAARPKPERLRVRLPLWALWLGRQPADHLGLEPGMLWVRVPPEPLEHEHALVEQPGVFACLSRRRSRVQIPSRALVTRREERPEPRAGRRSREAGTARYANRQSGQAQTLVTAGSTPARAT